MQVVEPASHEFVANFLFDEHGLDPFFATDAGSKLPTGSAVTSSTAMASNSKSN